VSAAGRLFAVEGPDGVGRTTLVRALAEQLAAAGHAVTTVRLRGSPGLRGPLRSLQRRADIAERALFLLYAADLADVYAHEIAPALAEGRVVLADRYVMTPVVRAEARGIDPAWACDVLAFLPAPQRTLVLQAEAAVRLRRMLMRRRFLTPRESGLGATYRRDPQAMLVRYQHLMDELFARRVDGQAAVGLDASVGPRDLLSAARRALSADLPAPPKAGIPPGGFREGVKA